MDENVFRQFHFCFDFGKMNILRFRLYRFTENGLNTKPSNKSPLFCVLNLNAGSNQNTWIWFVSPLKVVALVFVLKFSGITSELIISCFVFPLN